MLLDEFEELCCQKQFGLPEHIAANIQNAILLLLDLPLQCTHLFYDVRVLDVVARYLLQHLRVFLHQAMRF